MNIINNTQLSQINEVIENVRNNYEKKGKIQRFHEELGKLGDSDPNHWYGYEESYQFTLHHPELQLPEPNPIYIVPVGVEDTNEEIQARYPYRCICGTPMEKVAYMVHKINNNITVAVGRECVKKVLRPEDRNKRCVTCKELNKSKFSDCKGCRDFSIFRIKNGKYPKLNLNEIYDRDKKYFDQLYLLEKISLKQVNLTIKNHDKYLQDKNETQKIRDVNLKFTNVPITQFKMFEEIVISQDFLESKKLKRSEKNVHQKVNEVNDLCEDQKIFKLVKEKQIKDQKRDYIYDSMYPKEVIIGITSEGRNIMCSYAFFHFLEKIKLEHFQENIS